MITPKYFMKYCETLFNGACRFTTEDTSMSQRNYKCYYKNSLVALLEVNNDLSTYAYVYSPSRDSVWPTAYKWRFRHMLKKQTYVARNQAAIIRSISRLVNDKFYAHPKEIYKIIDQITDDVFSCDLSEIAMKLMDKADMCMYQEIRWRNEKHEIDKDSSCSDGDTV